MKYNTQKRFTNHKEKRCEKVTQQLAPQIHFFKVNEGLRQHYVRTLRPFEDSHLFHSLHSPPLEDAEFSCRPSVLLVGQYSTGKTTFIRCVPS